MSEPGAAVDDLAEHMRIVERERRIAMELGRARLLHASKFPFWTVACSITIILLALILATHTVHLWR